MMLLLLTAGPLLLRLAQSGSFTAPSHPLWDRNLTGSGQIISIGDTGVAWASCFFRDDQVEIPIGQLRTSQLLPH